MSSKVQGPTTAGGCDPCGPSRRNRYYSGKRMRVADYDLEQAYHIGRRRLVNRAMLGWGVVEGFAIRGQQRGVTVGPGLALDACGRELVAAEPTRLRAAEDLVWLVPSGDACCAFKPGDPPQPPAATEGTPAPETGKTCWLLSAHYAERRLDGVLIDDGCATRCEPDSLCETVVYSLRPVDCCEAGLPDCRCPRCAGENRCACEAPSGPEPVQPADGEEPPGGERCFSLDRGNHRQLVLWSLDRRGRTHACEEGPLRAHGCIALDPCAGVPLACVTLAFDCGEPVISEVVDDAHPRRLARRNEDLFDLLHGCDLTRIADVGWRDWLAPSRRRVAFTDFAAMFDPPAYPATPGRRPLVPVTTRFTVGFTGPVRVDCLTPDVLAVTLVSGAVAEDLGDMVRVPLYDLAADPPRLSDPAGTTRGFTARIPSTYWEGELDPRARSTFERATIVEIEIRTDFIEDCNGQQVAGGGRYLPSSGCVPGGRFLSSFVVVPDGTGTATGQEA